MLYGMYFDYYGYDKTLKCVSDTVIGCKYAFYKYCENFKEYKEYLNEYTFVEITKNKWGCFSKPIDI